MKINRCLGRSFGQKYSWKSQMTHRERRYVILKLETLEDRVVLDDASTDAVTGIHSRNLIAPGLVSLTGSGVSIGQVETGRPGKPGFDDANNSHPDVTPTAVFFRNGAALANDTTSFSDGHATKVAGVMIANGAVNKGVAAGASLYASAHAAAGAAEAQQHRLFALSIQHVALQDSEEVRATNLSFGIPGTLNGESLATHSVDWSARVHDLLYAIGRGNTVASGGNGTRVPADSLNAIKVAATKKDGQGVFRIVWEGSDFTNVADGRRLTDIVAPGADILVPPIEGDPYLLDSGTSDAAPHVAGTVALLQEYAGAAWWGDNARSHLVMKAVLMNSVDKIKDTGDGLRLGMEKTIQKTNGTTWLESDARDEPNNQGGKVLPLDNELGTGQLNAKRAVDQFSPGEQEPPGVGMPGVSPIAWDYNTINAEGDKKVYPFAAKLKANSYVSLTLAWDRYVGLNDTNTNGLYDSGETFTSAPLIDLNLHLLPKGATDISQSIWSSDSTLYNLEHMFYKVETEGYYEFWVRRNNGGDTNKPYAVAWWTAPVAVSQERPGRKSSGTFSLASAHQFQSAATAHFWHTSSTVVPSPLPSRNDRTANDLAARRKNEALEQMVVERKFDWPISLDQEIKVASRTESELLQSSFADNFDTVGISSKTAPLAKL